MEFSQLIQRRWSVRKYKNIPIPEEKIQKVLETARLAPSAANRQPWHFIVIQDEEIKNRLKEAYGKEWFFTAPTIICACGEPSKSWVRFDGKNYCDIDLAITMDHLILAATAEGLGTCWIGAFHPDVTRKVLKLPEGIEPIVFTPLGYPDESCPPAKKRKSLEEIVHKNRW